jgi:hypothetical protein
MALLDGDLRAEIGTNPDLVAIMLPGTLTTYAVARVNGREVKTPTTHNVRGFFDNRRYAVIDGGGQASERIVLLLAIDATGNVLVRPSPGDRVELAGETVTVQTCEVDPAGATYTLRLRQTGAS